MLVDRIREVSLAVSRVVICKVPTYYTYYKIHSDSLTGTASWLWIGGELRGPNSSYHFHVGWLVNLFNHIVAVLRRLQQVRYMNLASL